MMEMVNAVLFTASKEAGDQSPYTVLYKYKFENGGWNGIGTDLAR